MQSNFEVSCGVTKEDFDAEYGDIGLSTNKITVLAEKIREISYYAALGLSVVGFGAMKLNNNFFFHLVAVSSFYPAAYIMYYILKDDRYTV